MKDKLAPEEQEILRAYEAGGLKNVKNRLVNIRMGTAGRINEFG